MKEEIKEELLKKADLKYKEFHGGLCPGTDNIIGIRVPILREYAKELAKKYDIKELLSEIDNEYYEEIMLKRHAYRLRKGRVWSYKKTYRRFYT